MTAPCNTFFFFQILLSFFSTLICNFVTHLNLPPDNDLSEREKKKNPKTHTKKAMQFWTLNLCGSSHTNLDQIFLHNCLSNAEILSETYLATIKCFSRRYIHTTLIKSKKSTLTNGHHRFDM